MNNAGAYKSEKFEKMMPETFHWHLDLLVGAPIFLTQKLIPSLSNAKKSSVINISSCASLGVAPKSLNYGMCKHSLDYFTEFVALKYAHRGIRCNGIQLAHVSTAINNHEFPPNTPQ